MDFDALARDLSAKTAQAFSTFAEEKSGEGIYAFCLYTDSGAMTVCAAAATEARLAEILAEEDDGDPATRAYYRWAFSEWTYEGLDEEAFEENCRALRDGALEGDIGRFLANLVEAMTEALEDLRASGTVADDVALFVSISDDDEARAIEDESAARLNDAELLDRFLKRYGEE